MQVGDRIELNNVTIKGDDTGNYGQMMIEGDIWVAPPSSYMNSPDPAPPLNPPLLHRFRVAVSGDPDEVPTKTLQLEENGIWHNIPEVYI